MSIFIEAHIPFGDFKIIKDGKEIENLIGFEFAANVEDVSKIEYSYGDVYKEKDEKIEARKTLLAMTTKFHKIEIDVKGPFSNDIFVYIDGQRQNALQEIRLKTDLYASNQMDLKYAIIF